ncbi:hypothetical protein J6590_025482 [Homalodisca vitripennis]|nr:hypothetical protein J6590_025482 [Homalodisca vitripennis]
MRELVWRENETCCSIERLREPVVGFDPDSSETLDVAHIRLVLITLPIGSEGNEPIRTVTAEKRKSSNFLLNKNTVLLNAGKSDVREVEQASRSI